MIGTKLLHHFAAESHRKVAGDLESLRNRLGRNALSMDEWNALVEAAAFLSIEASRRQRMFEEDQEP